MIGRIDINKLSEERFIKEFFAKEIPLIFTNVSSEWDKKQWSKERLLKLINEENCTKNKLWYQTDIGFNGLANVTPNIIKKSLDKNLSYSRQQNIRLWSNVLGDRTLLHMDSNDLFVFNLQLKGSKHWTIYSTNTSFKLYTLTNVPYLEYNEYVDSQIKEKEIQFELKEGEMLFLPAFWYHKVKVTSTDTLNINWVGTKIIQSQSYALDRENMLLRALLPLSKIFPLTHKVVDMLMGNSEKDYFNNFAGNGSYNFILKKIKSYSLLKSISYLVKELFSIHKLVLDFHRIKNYSKSSLTQE